MSTQNVNVTRFARNVEWGPYDFQTPCSCLLFQLIFSYLATKWDIFCWFSNCWWYQSPPPYHFETVSRGLRVESQMSLEPAVQWSSYEYAHAVRMNTLPLFHMDIPRENRAKEETLTIFTFDFIHSIAMHSRFPSPLSCQLRWIEVGFWDVCLLITHA